MYIKSEMWVDDIILFYLFELQYVKDKSGSLTRA